jgi:hypothetical protein
MAIQFATSDTNVLSSVIIGYYVIGLGIGFAWYCTSRFRPGVRVLFAALTILTVIGGINAGTYAVSANTHSVAHADHGSSYDVANAFGLNPEQAYPFVLEGAVAPKPAEPYFELPSLTPDKSGNLTIVFVNNGSTQLTIPARHVKLGNSDAWDNKRSMLASRSADSAGCLHQEVAVRTNCRNRRLSPPQGFDARGSGSSMFYHHFFSPAHTLYLYTWM